MSPISSLSSSPHSTLGRARNKVTWPDVQCIPNSTINVGTIRKRTIFAVAPSAWFCKIQTGLLYAWPHWSLYVLSPRVDVTHAQTSESLLKPQCHFFHTLAKRDVLFSLYSVCTFSPTFCLHGLGPGECWVPFLSAVRFDLNGILRLSSFQIVPLHVLGVVSCSCIRILSHSKGVLLPDGRALLWNRRRRRHSHCNRRRRRRWRRAAPIHRHWHLPLLIHSGPILTVIAIDYPTPEARLPKPNHDALSGDDYVAHGLVSVRSEMANIATACFEQWYIRHKILSIIYFTEDITYI